MAYRLEESQDSHTKSIAYFDVPPVESSIERKEFIPYRPQSQPKSDSVMEFNIPGNSLYYVSLAESLLCLSLAIIKSDGTRVKASDSIAFINLPLHSLWSQVDLSLQQETISSVGTNYPFKAYFDTVLGSSKTLKESKLQSQLYYEDEAGNMDDHDPILGGNLGLGNRWTFTKDGQIVDLEGPLFLDIAQQDRYILNGVQITIKLWPHKDNFRLMGKLPTSGGISYKIDIIDAVYKLCMVKVSPGVQIGHAAALKISPALYPFDKSVIKTYSIPSGYYNKNVDDVFQGEVPTTLIVALLASDAYNGSLSKNPFNFQHFNCSFLGFYVDGQSVPHKPFQPVYDNNLYVEAYLSLFTDNDSHGISRKDYPKGYCIYKFNINETGSENQLPLIKKGHTRLDLNFDKALKEHCTIIIYAKFPVLMKIDESRNIIL